MHIWKKINQGLIMKCLADLTPGMFQGLELAVMAKARCKGLCPQANSRACTLPVHETDAQNQKSDFYLAPPTEVLRSTGL